MSSGEKYVAAAYGVVFVFVLIWVAIMATKLARLERQTAELAELARERRVAPTAAAAPTELAREPRAAPMSADG